MEMRKRKTANQVQGGAMARYAPIAAGCLLAMLALPGYAWQDAAQHSTATVAGEFTGEPPIQWEYKAGTVSLPGLTTLNFYKSGLTKYIANITSASSTTPLFQVVQKEAHRHTSIPHMKVEYIDKDGATITPTWKPSDENVQLAIPGTISSGSGTTEMMLNIKMRVGHGLLGVWDTSANATEYCLQNGLETKSTMEIQFSGMHSVIPTDIIRTVSDESHLLKQGVFTQAELLQRAGASGRSTNACASGFVSKMNVDRNNYAGRIAENGISIPDAKTSNQVQMLNNNSKSIFFAGLFLSADTELQIQTESKPYPGNWNAPFTVRISTI